MISDEKSNSPAGAKFVMHTGDVLLFTPSHRRTNPAALEISTIRLKCHEFKLGLKSFMCVCLSLALAKRSFNQHYSKLLLPALFVFPSSDLNLGRQISPAKAYNCVKRLKSLRLTFDRQKLVVSIRDAEIRLFAYPCGRREIELHNNGSLLAMNNLKHTNEYLCEEFNYS